MRAGKWLMAAASAMIVATAGAAVSEESIQGRVSSLDDITYWVGEGTNKVAVVVDFAQGAGSSLVWGYRWNGTANLKDAFDAISADDPRFAAKISSSGWVNGFTYDADLDGVMEYAPASDYGYAADFSYMFGHDWKAKYATGERFNNLVWTENETTTTGMALVPETWYSQTYYYYEMSMDDWSYLETSESGDAHLPRQATRSTRFADVRYWVGSGLNAAVIVVDFNQPGTNSVFMWGYRWNGTANYMDALNAIAKADPRFGANLSSSGWVNGFSYDVDGDGAVDLKPESDYDFSEDYTVMFGHDWKAMNAVGEFFDGLAWIDNPDVTAGMVLVDGAWYSQKYYYYEMDASDMTAPVWPYLSGTEKGEPASPFAREPSAAEQEQMASVKGASFVDLAGAFDAARGGKEILLPASATVDAATKTITVGTEESGTVQTYQLPAWFDLSQKGSTVSYSLNAVATPVLEADSGSETKPFSVDGDMVTVVPGNVIDGLYYGLQTAKDLSKGFTPPTKWVRAENGSVVLEAAKAGNAGFYKVSVSDISK